MPESDKSLPENSKKNLDEKLDHAIYETFPTSDPVSVQVTKGGAIDYDDAGNPISPDQAQARGGSSEGVLGQAQDTLQGIASTVSETAQGVYEEGRRYAREAYEQGRRYAQE